MKILPPPIFLLSILKYREELADGDGNEPPA
jgi:hypothetical protein